MKNLKIIDNIKNIEGVEIDGIRYALNGWNGEKYTSCFTVDENSIGNETPDEYTLEPIYRFQEENIDISNLKEGIDEYDKAIEIVDYTISKN